MDTDEIMHVATDMAGMAEVPADSAVYVQGAGIARVLMGVDIAGAELLLARQLGVDAVIAHHPAGGDAVLNFPKVLSRQIEFMIEAGVPLEIARQTVQPAMRRGLLRAQTANADHVPSFARLIGMPFLNVHLALDELGRRVMVAAIAAHAASALDRPMTVSDIVDALRTIPEIGHAPTRVMVPVGRLDHLAGKVAVFHGAGTNGGAAVARALFAAGVGTVVYIHISPEEAEALNRGDVSGNLIVSGHIASDLIGINLFVAELEKRGLEVVRMSGL